MDEKKQEKTDNHKQLRSKWIIGSKCQITPYGGNEWFVGRIVRIYNRENKEYLVVELWGYDNRYVIGRCDSWIRPIIDSCDEVY